MELERILKKYFYAPPVSKGFDKDTCMICGTPLNKKDWAKQRIKAHSDILNWIKEKLLSEKELIEIIRKVVYEDHIEAIPELAKAIHHQALKNLGINP